MNTIPTCILILRQNDLAKVTTAQYAQHSEALYAQRSHRWTYHFRCSRPTGVLKVACHLRPTTRSTTTTIEQWRSSGALQTKCRSTARMMELLLRWLNWRLGIVKWILQRRLLLMWIELRRLGKLDNGRWGSVRVLGVAVVYGENLEWLNDLDGVFTRVC